MSDLTHALSRARRAERHAADLEVIISVLRGRHHPGLTDANMARLTAEVHLCNELALAADPTAGRRYDTVRTRHGTDPPDPGAATRYARRIAARHGRRHWQSIEDATAQLDGDYTPAPKCARCGRSTRLTDRFCGKCGERLAQPSNEEPKPAPAPSGKAQPADTVADAIAKRLRSTPKVGNP